MTGSDPLLAAVLVLWAAVLGAAWAAAYAVWWLVSRYGRTLLLVPLVAPVCVWLWLRELARAGHHYPYQEATS